jgi:hypothetical protein
VNVEDVLNGILTVRRLSAPAATLLADDLASVGSVYMDRRRFYIERSWYAVDLAGDPYEHRGDTCDSCDLYVWRQRGVVEPDFVVEDLTRAERLALAAALRAYAAQQAPDDGGTASLGPSSGFRRAVV